MTDPDLTLRYAVDAVVDWLGSIEGLHAERVEVHEGLVIVLRPPTRWDIRVRTVALAVRDGRLSTADGPPFDSAGDVVDHLVGWFVRDGGLARLRPELLAAEAGALRLVSHGEWISVGVEERRRWIADLEAGVPSTVVSCRFVGPPPDPVDVPCAHAASAGLSWVVLDSHGDSGSVRIRGFPRGLRAPAPPRSAGAPR